MITRKNIFLSSQNVLLNKFGFATNECAYYFRKAFIQKLVDIGDTEIVIGHEFEEILITDNINKPFKFYKYGK